jgi:cytochrome c
MVSGRRAWGLSLLLALGACGGPAPPPAESPSAEPPPPPAASAPQGGAAGFDVGPIKSPDEWLAEPELAAADRGRGKLLSLACAACHTFGAGEKPIVGPNLHGVFGRPAASVPEFAYSPALRSSGLVWTPRALDAWLSDPQRFVVGTTMTFTGYKDAADRRALIAYLLEATR